MPVLHSVMMLKVSEASRATSVTRAAAAAAAAQAAASAHRRNSLTLHHALHVSAESSAAVHHAVAPVTPHAADLMASKSACSASPATAFSPREPSSKVAATSPPVFASKSQSYSSSSSIKPTIVAPSPPVAAALASDSAPSSSEPSPVGKRGHTASSSTPKSLSSASPKSMKANTGRWTDAEHKLFLKGLETFPYRAWKKIATLIKTRTVVQIRTHAQKYYQKLEKEEARSKDREHQHGGGYSKDNTSSSLSAASLASLASHLSDDDYSDSSASTPRASSPAKKKSMLRKRKFTMDDDASATSSSSMSAAAAMDAANNSMTLPSLPKRMMKEKKFPREKHMSPKQKAPVSNNKFFGSSFSSPELGPCETAHRAVFGRSAAAAIHKIPPHPLDFECDASSEGMILDFADDKSMAEYPFHLDGAMDQSMSSMDNDDLLQLTDEESLDWFSTAAGDDDDLLKVEPLEDLVVEDDDDDASASTDCPMDISDSSPLTLGRYHFSPLYTDECLQFSDSGAPDDDNSGCSSPSSTMLSACDAEDFILSEDDDFVLDPEKFLSSYFSPSSSAN